METYCAEYAAVLAAAQSHLDHGDFAAAEDTVRPLLSDKIRVDNRSAFLFGSRIAAFAAAFSHGYQRAKEYALDALRLDENLLDLQFLLVYVFAKLEEYPLVTAYGDKYLNLLNHMVAGKNSDCVLTDTHDKAHEVLNAMGVAQREAGCLDQAVELFERALQSRRDYEPAYINLAGLMRHQGRYREAVRLLKAGMRVCPDSQELRMLKDSIESVEPTVSACMIVKNEEKRLPRALESIRDVCDELIVVDTGSTDRTVEIAKSYGAHVYHHEWESDFSKARNQSLSYATKDWILVIDADEELEREDIPMLREILRRTECNLVSVSVYNLSSDDMHATSFLPSIRLFRKSLGAHYDGIVHNQLRFDEKRNIVLRAGVRIKHFGYGLSAEEMEKKIARSRALLLKQLENDPNNAFANFNLAQLYRGQSPNPSPEVCDDIIRYASRAIERTDVNKRGERHIHLMALHQMVTAFFFKRELDEAERYCHRALEHKQDFLDPIIALGHIYSQKGDWPSARKWFLKYLDERARFKHSDETLQIILLNYESRHVAYYGLGIVSEAEGKATEAIEWYTKAMQSCPDYADTHLRLAQLHYNGGDYDAAILEAHRELERNSGAWPAHYILGEIFMNLGKVIPAEKHLVEADRQQNGNRDILMALARLYLMMERFSEAGSVANRLESEFPDFMPAAKLIGDIRYALADYRRAIMVYERLTCSGQSDEDVWNNLGNSYFKLGDFSESERCYRTALSIKPDMALAARNLGISLAQSGKTDEAADKLSSFLELAPNDFPVAQLLGDIMVEKGQLSRALKLYELCVSLEPTSYAVITKLADVYREQGHDASARLGYMQALKLRPDYEPAKSRLDELQTGTFEKSELTNRR